MKWRPEDWGRLGTQIRRSREEQGLSRKKLSERSGISEKSIQLTEEGRVPTRWPKSLQALEEALGWAPGSVVDVLDGGSPRSLQRDFLAPYPSVSASSGSPTFDLTRHGRRADEEHESRVRRDSSVSQTPESRAGQQGVSGEGLRGVWFAPLKTTLVGGASATREWFRDIEATQSMHLAQDMFVRQMKRFRALKGISLDELARGVAEFQGPTPLEGSLGAKELKRLEEGTRQLTGSDAEAIAAALGTTVGWLLGSSFSSDAPAEMKTPPTDEELQAEAKAVEQRISDLGMRVNMAHAQYSQAKRTEEAARQAAQLAQAIFDQALREQTELERQYQYLIGRIDSLRAAKGEELILQVAPVYEDAPSPADVALFDEPSVSAYETRAEALRALGNKFRVVRHRLGLSLRDVGKASKSPAHVIDAIESGQFSKIKGDAQTRGYVRAYASTLGLDPEEVLSEYFAAMSLPDDE